MLSQATGYAAAALACVTRAGGSPVLVRDIAQEADIPAPYLAKIIQILAKRGVVSTQRGVGGGVMLARAPDQISLYDVAVALEDPVVQTRCMLGEAECSDERACPAHAFWTAHRSMTIAFLCRTTIADMALFEARRHPHPQGDQGVE